MNKLFALASACLVALTGCGGGGGGGAATDAVAIPSTTIVSGIASKGLIKQARVMVCRIVGGVPEADSSCATGTTGSDGFYSVMMSDGHSGPAMIKVVPATGSLMMDETTGSDVPYSMTMRALVPSMSVDSTVHVTPFSEMAAQAMTLSMPMDATKMRQAIEAVQNAMTALGISLNAMPILDLKNDGSNAANLSNEANMIKQLARVAMAAKNSNVLADASGVPCNAAGTSTSQKFGCTVQAMASVMTSYVSYDATRMASLMAALNAQSVTAVTMPVRNVDGAISMQIVDMTSLSSMQAAMQNGGMSATSAATMANAMMGGMR